MAQEEYHQRIWRGKSTAGQIDDGTGPKITGLSEGGRCYDLLIRTFVGPSEWAYGKAVCKVRESVANVRSISFRSGEASSITRLGDLLKLGIPGRGPHGARTADSGAQRSSSDVMLGLGLGCLG